MQLLIICIQGRGRMNNGRTVESKTFMWKKDFEVRHSFFSNLLVFCFSTILLVEPNYYKSYWMHFDKKKKSHHSEFGIKSIISEFSVASHNMQSCTKQIINCYSTTKYFEGQMYKLYLEK